MTNSDEYWRQEFEEGSRLRRINADLLEALQKIISANDDFRRQLPEDWESDPLNDACIEAGAVIAEASRLKGD